MSQHQTHSTGIYHIVYVALLVLLAATVWVSLHDLNPFNSTIAVLIAGIKTALVLAWFMHVKGKGWLLWTCALCGFFFLAIMLSITFADYYTRVSNPL